MSRVLLQKTDLHGLAARGAIVKEGLAAAELPRLSPLLADTSATIACDLRLRLDSNGNILVEGIVETTLALTCQRCLEPVALPIGADVEAALAASEDALERLQREYETVLPADAVRLADLVEEEVLLALPLVAVHDSPEECGPLATRLAGADTEGPDDRTPNNPFAVLKSLRSD